MHTRGVRRIKADASAADPPANRKAAELRALEGPFRGRMDVFESIWGSFGVRFVHFRRIWGAEFGLKSLLGYLGGCLGAPGEPLALPWRGFRGFPGGSQGPFWAHVGDFGIPNGVQKCTKTVTKTRSELLHVLGVFWMGFGCPATLKMLLLCGRVCTDSLFGFFSSRWMLG